MDLARFAAWTSRWSGAPGSRRRFLQRITVTASSSVLAMLLLEDTEAKKKKKKKKDKGNNNGGNNGDGGSPTGGGDDGSSGSLDAEEMAFLNLLNNYRSANGLPSLTHNAQLGSAADVHAQDMATNNNTSHTGTDGSTSQQRIERAGYAWSWYGENIFWGDASGSVAFEWWKNSPPHNANMLSPNFTQTGISRAFNPAAEFSWYWTNTFGSPKQR